MAITGGVSIQLGGILLRLTIRSGRCRRSAAAGDRCLVAETATVRSALEWHWELLDARGLAARCLVVAVFAAFHWGAFIAGGSDSCYLNQAELLARGAVHDYEPLSEDPDMARQPWSFAPAGHIPMGSSGSGAGADLSRPATRCLMAGARRLAGRQRDVLDHPADGGLAVYLAFLLGRRLGGPAAGLLAAALTLSSPTFLISCFSR